MEDAKYDSLNEDPRPIVYFPLAQMGDVAEDSAFEIRTAIPPNSLIPAVRGAMASVNKLASLQFLTLKQEAYDSVIQQRILDLRSRP